MNQTNREIVLAPPVPLSLASSILPLAAGLVVWEAAGWLAGFRFLPPFSRVLWAAADLTMSGQIVTPLLGSLFSLAAGYCGAVLPGLLLGVMIGRYRTVEFVLSPYLHAFVAAPKFALVPVLFALFGLLSAFFVIVLNTARGIQMADPEHEAMTAAFGATERQLLGKALLPGAIPLTLAGLRLAKAQAMRRAGARVLPAYGGIDTGSIGLGCAHSEQTDDAHLCKDAFAVIGHPYPIAGTGASVPAFNLTSLLDTSSKVMLNYQSDDYGEMRKRSCGCPLERLGFTTHLHGIRGYSKLAGEAVTLVGEEMVRILGLHLSARFGGGPLDYQSMEEEDANGFTKLALIIDPGVRIADERQVIEFVMNSLTKSSPAGDSARRVCQQTQTLRVKRMAPILTARGKLLPLNMHKPGRT